MKLCDLVSIKEETLSDNLCGFHSKEQTFIWKISIISSQYCNLTSSSIFKKKNQTFLKCHIPHLVRHIKFQALKFWYEPLLQTVNHEIYRQTSACELKMTIDINGSIKRSIDWSINQSTDQSISINPSIIHWFLFLNLFIYSFVHWFSFI